MDAVCNTVQFKFPGGAPQPSWEEIAEFVKQLHSDPMKIEAVYRLPGRALCMKYKTEEAMEQMLRRPESIKFTYGNGNTVDVRLSIAGRNITYVRVFDIAQEVLDDDLEMVFSAYGKVESIVRERFPTGLGLDHLFTGVRGVHLEIKKEIPPSLEIGGWKARIFYEGLRDKCFLCGLQGHHKDACPQRKNKKTKQKKNGGPVSYAGVVESGTILLSDEVEIIEEEILEEEKEAILQSMQERMDQQKIEQQRKEEEEAEQRRLKQEKLNAGIAKIANAFQAAMDRHDANERRAKFAATGSTSTEILRPKKTARKS